MGTKNNPGKYDCYAKAEPDEPIFTLRANDPMAPFIVSMWASAMEQEGLADNPEKIVEARKCAADMLAWRKTHRSEMEWPKRGRNEQGG